LITNAIFLQIWRVPFAWFTRKSHVHDARF